MRLKHLYKEAVVINTEFWNRTKEMKFKHLNHIKKRLLSIRNDEKDEIQYAAVINTEFWNRTKR